MFVRGMVYFGATVALVSAIFAWRIASTRDAEMVRFQACREGTRQDCRPSLFWVVAGLVTPDADGRVPAVVGTVGNEQKRVIRSSDNAPILTSVRPEGFEANGPGFKVTKGANVSLTVSAEGAKKLEARLRLAGSEESVLLKELTPVKDQEFTFKAEFTWEETRAGDLEVVARGESEADETKLILPLRIEAVANQP